MFEKINNERFYRLICFAPCIMLMSGDDKNTNIAPIAWHTPINEDPALIGVAVASGHHTAKLIQKTREMSVNVPDMKMLPAIKICGSNSGKNMDKIKKSGLKTEPGEFIKVPHLKDAVAYMECRVKDIHDYKGVKFIVARVICTKMKKGTLKNNVISENANVGPHLGGGIFAKLGKRVKF